MVPKALAGVIADTIQDRSEDQKYKIRNFYLQYPYAFVTDDGEKRRTSIVKHKIDIGFAKPRNDMQAEGVN